MPELPEVETVKRTLEQFVIGKEIKDVDIYWPKMIKHPDDINVFRRLTVGQKINKIGRKGKFLLFYLDDYVLISHLRMEGKYGVYGPEEEKSKHTHVIFRFTDGQTLHYKDVRKFGTMHLYQIGEEFDLKPLNQLGVEPFSGAFTSDFLYEKLQKTSRVIKSALLDQSIVTGLGNIYVDEALFRSGIHPERLASSLAEYEVKRLKDEIIQTLSDAVQAGGTTIRSYLNSQGEIGMFQLKLMVYGKTGEPCRSCGTLIEKTRVGNRGTHICPNCQV